MVKVPLIDQPIPEFLDVLSFEVKLQGAEVQHTASIGMSIYNVQSPTRASVISSIDFAVQAPCDKLERGHCYSRCGNMDQDACVLCN